MPEAKVHCSRKRGRGLHPWVFSNEVLRVEGDPEPGDAVLVFDRKRFLGSAVYNPHSLIALRLFSPDERELDLEFIQARLSAAAERRKADLPGESDYRLAFGEADGLPGLVVDRYGEHYVVQVYSLGLERRLDAVTRALVDRFGPKSIFEKNDFRLRDPEGLERRQGVLYGTAGERVVIAENGARFEVDIVHGNKTGYFFDQRLTRQRVRRLARGRAFLDVFSYTGGFAVNAALGGAKRVLAVDSSAAACGIGATNAELNGVTDRCEFHVEEAFRFLKRLGTKPGEFDMICLDPPSFIKSRRERQGGLQGYRTINSLAMRALAPGGMLVSCSCSHHLFWQDMLDMLARAAQDAGRSFVITERTTQGPDHPVLLSMPETEYLRCFFLRVV